MGLFSPARDPRDSRQLLIAVHELGHAWAWKDGGRAVHSVHFSGDAGYVKATGTGHPDQLIAEATGFWAGFEAEDRWRKATGNGRAKHGNSCYDISQASKAIRLLKTEYGIQLNEGKVRALARKAIRLRWPEITHGAPELIRRGRLSI